METLTSDRRDHRLAWFAKTAEDVMATNPISVSREALIPDAAKLLTAKRISAAPVIDEAGRPIGVVSRADIVRHARADRSSLCECPRATVDEIMTPDVYFVRPDTGLMEVVESLLTCNVHRLFVVDKHGVLVGVISTSDVLRSLLPEPSPVSHDD